MIRRALKRLSIGLLGLLFSLILIVVLTTWLLLGTATGNRWLLSQVSELIPGELQVENWQGSLLDRVTITGVRYQLDDLSVSLDQLEAELVPASLTRGWLEFTSLSLGNLSLSLPPGQETDDSPAASLPGSLALPLGVRIDTLTLASLRVNGNQVVSELDARQLAAWRRFQLASLTTRTVSDISVEATAQGSLAAPIEIQGQASWQMPLTNNDTVTANQLAGQLELSGHLSALQLRHQLDAPLQIHSQGQWRLGEPQRPLALEHQWPAQPLPLTLPQPLSLGGGTLTTRGPLAALEIVGQSSLTSGDKTVNLSLNSQLIDGGLAVQQIKLDDGEQQLEGHGELLFSPLAWDLTVKGKLDTGLLHPRFPGQLSVQGNSRGRYTGEQWTLSPSRVQLEGRVRQQPLTANATLESHQQRLQLDSDVHWGDNRLRGRGALLPNWSLDTTVDLKRLDQLYPDLQGQLSGQLQVRGPMATPNLTGNLNGQQLGWQDWSLASLQTRFRALGLGQQTMSLELDSETLRQGDMEQLAAAHLSLNGTLANHTAMARFRRDEVSLETSLQGTLKGLKDTPQWQGTVSETGLMHQQLGRWQQAEDTAVQLSATAQSITPFCLEQTQSRLCLKGRRAADNQIDVNASLSALPLALAGALLGPDFAVQGSVDGEATLQGSLDNPNGHYQLQTRNARIAMRTADDPQELAIEQLSVQGTLQQRRLASELTLVSDLASAQATVEHGLDAESPLAGQVALQISSLAPLTLFTTDLREISGQVRGDFALDGTLRQPLMNGSIRLENGRALIPALGVAVTDLEMDVQGSPRGQLDVNGSATLGEGTMTLTGTLDPREWPASVNLSLNGQRLLVADRPDARVLLNPTLVLKGNLDELKLGGKLTVPEAEIRPTELPEGAVTVSKDQILVHQEGEKSSGLPLGIDVTVNLGDKVHFQGFGLDAMLGGTLQVEQQPQQPPQLNGELVIREGRYRAYGQNLAISDGQLIFQGPPDNPGLDIRAIRKVPSENVVVGVQLSGTLQEPEASLFSEPGMEQSQAMSYLLTGRPLERGSKGDNNQIAQALALYGLEKGSGVTEKLGDTLGVDEISVGSDWETDDAALMLGKQLSDRLYLTYAVGLFDAVSTVMLRYTLTRQLHLEARSSTRANSLDLIWEKELQ
ncbi:translocation/assembly module TamB domain-containing protein [Alcanivorax jadensis]|uniref:translocation/assembly module TamB domain-containing protein n=1 Tax=Alcanivorax jadensis TaxID=64988 RepID=UPI0026EF8972|nr:translocation/assembly module TamB domain-containing protein [Alcanivorax jadensis]